MPSSFASPSERSFMLNHQLMESYRAYKTIIRKECFF